MLCAGLLVKSLQMHQSWCRFRGWQAGEACMVASAAARLVQLYAPGTQDSLRRLTAHSRLPPHNSAPARWR